MTRSAGRAPEDGAEPRHRFNVDEYLIPVREKRLRNLPGHVSGAVRLVWRAAPREFGISAIMQVLAAAGTAAQLLIGRHVLAAVLSRSGHGGFTRIVPSLALLGVVTALVEFANMAQAEEQRLLSELVGRYAFNQVLGVSTAVGLLAFDSPEFHDRLQRAVVNASLRPAQMAVGVVGVLSSLLAIAGIAGALLFLQPLFLLVVLVAYAPAWIAATRASRVSYDFSVEQTERDRRRHYLEDVLGRKDEAKEIRAFNLGSFLRHRHDQLYDERIAELRSVVRRRLRLGLVGGILTSSLTAATIGLLAWFVTSGRLSVASAGAATGAVVLLGQRLRSLIGSAGALYESALFIEDFTSFAGSMSHLLASRPTKVPPDMFSTLRVDGVSFTYPSRDLPALRDVSMEIHGGEVVALVGENGSGKTTLAKLLAGLYPPDAGAITWDGVDMAECDSEQLRDSVAVIFQDFVKYYMSARENIGVGRHTRFDDLDAIRSAARHAGAHEFIEALDRAYDSILGPQFLGGSDLSIGQWQRMALARGFFRDAPFVILDEPTAALDPRAESQLFANIRSLFRDRAVLLISHRFSSVRSADRIYVLQDGRIVEHGTHAELVALGGLYAELFTLQAASYLDDVEPSSLKTRSRRSAS